MRHSGRAHEGRVAVLATPEGQLDPAGRRVNRLTKGAIARLVASADWEKTKPGKVVSLAFPTGMSAHAIDVVCLEKRGDGNLARKAGAALGARRGQAALLICAGNARDVAEVTFGAVMRDYTFDAHKTSGDAHEGQIRVMCSKPAEAAEAASPLLAIADGAFFTRDLVNEPANVLTTTEFATRLEALSDIGLKVEVLEEDALETLGMRTLLSVGQGSASPSKVVVMEWNGGGDEAPLALIGKGVVFDTGGISLKPAGGMEDMTMDMGGAGTVAGAMKALALRKAKANVVGLVGLG